MSIPEDSTPEDPNDQAPSQGDQQLNARIERRLEDWFAPAPLSNDHLNEIHARLEARPRPPRTLDGKQVSPLREAPPLSRRKILAIGAAIAASVGLGWIVLWPRSTGDSGVVFQRRPLVTVYRDMVDRGFEPYYVCDDDQRFRDVMKQRHGQTLVLSEVGNRLMSGLSYPGGWTAETTAILFRVDGEPVIIFVDDAPINLGLLERSPNLNLRSKSENGIWLIEVSPTSRSLLDEVEIDVQ